MTGARFKVDEFDEDGEQWATPGHVALATFTRKVVHKLAEDLDHDHVLLFLDGHLPVEWSVHLYCVPDPHQAEGEFYYFQTSPTREDGLPVEPWTVCRLEGGWQLAEVAKVPGPPCPDCRARTEPGEDPEHYGGCPSIVAPAQPLADRLIRRTVRG